MSLQPAREGVLSVLQFTRMVGETLAGAYPAVWVRGPRGAASHRAGDRQVDPVAAPRWTE
jgi:hypothetical protein